MGAGGVSTASYGCAGIPTGIPCALCSRKGMDVNAAEADGATALLWASYGMISKAPSCSFALEPRRTLANDLGVTPLGPRARTEVFPIGPKTARSWANPNAALLLGETPLMVAARAGYPDIVEALLAKDANVNARAAEDRQRSCGGSSEASRRRSRRCSRTAPTSRLARRSGAR